MDPTDEDETDSDGLRKRVHGESLEMAADSCARKDQDRGQLDETAKCVCRGSRGA